MYLQSVLIKPASGLCDMRCSYCFYRDETSKREQASYGMMSEDTLKMVIKRMLLQAEGPVNFAFQGGEPTLRGLPFFEKVMEFERRFNQKGVQITNAIQTNGYALDETWCRFLRENHFLVGISLDGTQACHDRFRRSQGGEPTYDRVRRAVRLLDDYGVDYNILTVVNRETAANIREIYQLYKREGWRYQQYITCLDPLGEEKGVQPYSLTPQDYGQFLVELFELWYKDWRKQKQPFIRQFENYILILLGYLPESCEQRGSCSIQGVVEADGSVYPCDFYALDDYKLGNINDQKFSEILAHEAGKRFLTESWRTSGKCQKCPYVSLCRNGCRRSRVADPQTGEPVNYFCESYRMFFEKTLPRLQEIAAFSKTAKFGK